MVNGFWQTQGGVFSVLEGADSGYPLETRTHTHIPSLKGLLKKKGHRVFKMSYALESLSHHEAGSVRETEKLQMARGIVDSSHTVLVKYRGQKKQCWDQFRLGT